MFGLIDILGSVLSAKFDLNHWITHKDILQRQFTVMSIKESEVMGLSIQDLYRMKQEYLEAYEELFNTSFNKLKKALTLKLQMMKVCADDEKRKIDKWSISSSHSDEAN